ncbi:MAG: FAD-dependent thymidylate synthase [Pseudomonadota bacterium]
MSIDSNQLEAIREQQASYYTTKRATVPELEEILYTPFPILDHGFVRVVDYMGDDSSVVQAARVSYGRGTKKVNKDQGLINYLMRHRHTTPFEMAEIKYHIKLPIFVAREWIRHRTANVNEYSARYSILGREFYLPKAEDLAEQSKNNRQGREKSLSPEQAKRVLHILSQDAQQTYAHYQEMLNADEEGNILDETQPCLARELARINLTINHYTEWYWKIDLHNLLHFLSLRADDHAQYEIRVYAEKMLETVKKWVPLTYAAFLKYRLHGAHFSQVGLQVIQRMLAGEQIDQYNSGMNPREWRELMATLEVDQSNTTSDAA